MLSNPIGLLLLFSAIATAAPKPDANLKRLWDPVERTVTYRPTDGVLFGVWRAMPSLVISETTNTLHITFLRRYASGTARGPIYLESVQVRAGTNLFTTGPKSSILDTSRDSESLSITEHTHPLILSTLADTNHTVLIRLNGRNHSEDFTFPARDRAYIFQLQKLRELINSGAYKVPLK